MTMRSVQDRFWSDGWVRKLNPLDRYLFLYLITNEHTNWAGVYELEIGMMAYESGIDREELERSMLPRLSPKIIHVDGWVYVPNWIKHHMSDRGKLTPDQQKAIEKAWTSVPDNIRLKIKAIEETGGIPPSPPPPQGDRSVPSSFALSSSFASAFSPVADAPLGVYEAPEDGKSLKKPRTTLKGFEEFWGLYPRKEDKVSASAAWRELSTDERVSASEDLKTRAVSTAWKKENGKYIPLAKNYLAGKRWEDQGVITEKSTKYDKYA